MHDMRKEKDFIVAGALGLFTVLGILAYKTFIRRVLCDDEYYNDHHRNCCKDLNKDDHHGVEYLEVM